MKPKDGSLKGYLFKDAKKNKVFVTDKPQPGAKTCQTNYKVLAKRKDLSLVECELITGRTHQIRAQFAHAGHPLLGDGKYGINRDDARLGYKFQALYARKLIFHFTDDSGALGYLRGREVALPDDAVWFYDDFFNRPVSVEASSSKKPQQPSRAAHAAPRTHGQGGQARSGAASKGRKTSGGHQKGGRR